jgi:hypothetical protein
MMIIVTAIIANVRDIPIVKDLIVIPQLIVRIYSYPNVVLYFASLDLLNKNGQLVASSNKGYYLTDSFSYH